MFSDELKRAESGGSQSYRRQLAKWALAIRDSGRNEKLAALTALSMAERPLLLKRLNWLKDARQSRSVSSSQKWLVALVAVTFCTLISVANPTQRLLASTALQDGVVVDQTAKEESSPVANVEKNIDIPTLEVEQTEMLQLPGKVPDLDWDNQVTVHGVVRSENGKPVSNAEVMIAELIDQTGVWGVFREGSVFSNSNGEFKAILPGRCRQFKIRSTANGYEKFAGDFQSTDKLEIRLQAEDASKTQLKEAGLAATVAVKQSEADADFRKRNETEFKDAINSLSEFRPSKYLELQELKIVSGGKTDKGDYLFLCDTKVVWLKSRKELMNMQANFLKKFAKKHDGSMTALAVIPLAMQISMVESMFPEFESGDVHSNRKIRVRGERAGDSIIVTSVTPSDFMVGSTGSAIDQLLQTLKALESNKLPTAAENAAIKVKMEHKEVPPAVSK